MTNGFEIAYTMLYAEDKQDAVFYIDSADAQWVATVEYGDDKLEVWRVGEMKIYHADGEYPFRYTDQLFDAGITNDAELEAAELEWDMNPWFELYHPVSQEWTSVIAHEVYDAVYQAGQMLTSGDLPPYTS